MCREKESRGLGSVGNDWFEIRIKEKISWGQFPKTAIILYSVRIIRAILRNFRSKVDALFWQDPVLLKLWRITTGAMYLNLSNTAVYQKCRKGQKSRIQKILRIFKWHLFNETAKFNSAYYQYFDNIIFNSNYVTSTNCLKRINLSLNDAAAGDNLPTGLPRPCFMEI